MSNNYFRTYNSGQTKVTRGLLILIIEGSSSKYRAAKSPELTSIINDAKEEVILEDRASNDVLNTKISNNSRQTLPQSSGLTSIITYAKGDVSLEERSSNDGLNKNISNGTRLTPPETEG